MTLSSHPGAICKQFYHWQNPKDATAIDPLSQKPRKTFLGYEFWESCGGDESDTIYCSFEQENYIALRERNPTTGKLELSPFIFDVQNWNLSVGTPVHFTRAYVSEDSYSNGFYSSAGGGSDWFINSDGTVSCKHMPELCLGFSTVDDHAILPAKYQGLKVFKRDYSIRARITYAINQVIACSTGRWFTRNMEHNLKDVPEQVYDRLMAEWNNLGLVSSLMLSIAFETFSNPLDPDVFNPEYITFFGIEAGNFINLINWLSILCDFVGIVAIILLAMGLNTIPSELAGEFVSQFSLILSVPEIMVLSGLILYMVAAVLMGYVNYGDSFSFGIIAFVATMVFSSVFLFILPLTLDRDGGLWEQARKINDDAAREIDRQKKGFLVSGAEEIEEAVLETVCASCL